MVLIGLTTEQKEKIASKYPEWMADNRPEWMMYNYPDWMAHNRPEWMADNHLQWLISSQYEELPDYIIKDKTMLQNQELIGLQNILAKNLNLQENLKKDIALKEGYLAKLEDEEQYIENGIEVLTGVILPDDEGKERIFNNITNDILEDIDFNLDENEKGEITH